MSELIFPLVLPVVILAGWGLLVLLMTPFFRETGRGLLANGDSGVIFGQAMAGQVGVVCRVQGRRLRRETIDEHIVPGPGGSRRR